MTGPPYPIRCVWATAEGPASRRNLGQTQSSPAKSYTSSLLASGRASRTPAGIRLRGLEKGRCSRSSAPGAERPIKWTNAASLRTGSRCGVRSARPRSRSIRPRASLRAGPSLAPRSAAECRRAVRRRPPLNSAAPASPCSALRLRRRVTRRRLRPRVTHRRLRRRVTHQPICRASPALRATTFRCALTWVEA
jgi:hypothetical protein